MYFYQVYTEEQTSLEEVSPSLEKYNMSKSIPKVAINIAKSMWILSEQGSWMNESINKRVETIQK